MPATLEEVRNVILQEFPDADPEDVVEEDHRIFGTIRSREFKPIKDSTERNRLVTTKVRDRLGLRGLNVGILFPRAPGEKH